MSKAQPHIVSSKYLIGTYDLYPSKTAAQAALAGRVREWRGKAGRHTATKEPLILGHSSGTTAYDYSIEVWSLKRDHAASQVLTTLPAWMAQKSNGGMSAWAATKSAVQVVLDTYTALQTTIQRARRERWNIDLLQERDAALTNGEQWAGVVVSAVIVMEGKAKGLAAGYSYDVTLDGVSQKVYKGGDQHLAIWHLARLLYTPVEVEEPVPA